jgi:hypothetical protein
VALPLICHSSYRGVIEFIRDLLGVSVSVGAVHDALQSAARQAGLINDAEDLSGIRVGLHDEIFQGSLCQERVPVEHGAVPKMKDGPSEPACRSRLQTAVSCFGSKDRGSERYGQKA